MARLKKSRKNDPSYRTQGKSRYPVERVFSVAIANNTDILIDVGAALSAINHRLYRQGKLYTVKIESPLYQPPGVGVFLKRLPDTWWMQKAYHLAMQARDDQLAQSSRPRGRWDDFRVGWSSALKTSTAPSHSDYSATWTADELQLSKVHDATTSTDHEFVAWGAARDATNNLYGIIEQYDQIGNTLPSPGQSGTGAYTNTYADAGLVESAGDNKATQGDDAPYDMDSFNGASDVGAIQLGTLGTIQSGTGDGRISVIADLPLGLLKVENTTAVGQVVQITVMKGDYKGVKAVDY